MSWFWILAFFVIGIGVTYGVLGVGIEAGSSVVDLLVYFMSCGLSAYEMEF
jgi:hypothetical protein